MQNSHLFPTHFVSHGAGPWPYMKQEWMIGAHDSLERALKLLPSTLPVRPQAILVISAHWEEAQFTVMTNAHPPMLYDYGGFPAHTYQVQYPAPGAPALAQRAYDLIAAAGLPVALNAQRGFDHGTFVPLSVSYPEADIPVFQVSLRADLDPAAHLALGRALQPLREDGVLILASGMTYHNHNMRNRGADASGKSKQFDDWLFATLNSAPAERWNQLINWASAPMGREAHPREEHLIPLLVALGASWEEPAVRTYYEPQYLGVATVSSYQFGGV